MKQSEVNKLLALPELQFIPINKSKRPMVEEWQKTKTLHDFKKAWGIGLVTGEISGNIEAIDIDCKYDLTGTLFRDYKKAINEVNPELLQKMTVQKTMSGGYHFIYKCSILEGNKKLARRPTTDEERESKPDEKVKVLIETRGDRGYIAVAPSEGYKMIFGSLDNIQEITPEERQTLFMIAGSFNELIQEYTPPKIQKVAAKKVRGLSAFEDYNQQADVVELLLKHGWTIKGHKGSKVLMLRPGDSKADHSGNYDSSNNWFSVFSTSTQFEAEKAYLPYAVYAILECNGDFSRASRELYEMGYGDRHENNKNQVIESAPSRVDMIADAEDNPYLATEEDFEDYLEQWRNGTFPMGHTTGFPGLDNHFRFKDGNLVIINGIDNVGKSTVIWYLAAVSCIFNDWKWIIYSSENRVGMVVKKLIEFFWCTPIKDLTDEQYTFGKRWVKDNFAIIKNSDELYNYKDILNIAKLTMKKGKYNAMLIDPYNSLKVSIPVKSAQSVYDYHYQAASELKLFGSNNELSIYLNCHAGTNAARSKDKDGFTNPPGKEDTEFGVMFANKADEFLTIHRLTSHPTEWMMTQIHVRKVKETETGGKVTSFADPVILKPVGSMIGFGEGGQFSGYWFNPVVQWHKEHGYIVGGSERKESAEMTGIPIQNENVSPGSGKLSSMLNIPDQWERIDRPDAGMMPNTFFDENGEAPF